METLDAAAWAAVGSFGTAALTMLGKVALAWAKRRGTVERSEVIRDERVQLATIQVEAAREERTEAKLWERLTAVEAETKRCEEQRQADRIEHERQRQADREECERHTERRVSEAVECVTRKMTRQLHSLLDIMRRSPSVIPRTVRMGDFLRNLALAVAPTVADFALSTFRDSVTARREASEPCAHGRAGGRLCAPCFDARTATPHPEDDGA